jgi:hypothetical protein
MRRLLPIKTAQLDAMKPRRACAALDNSIQCRYTVNGQIMSSTLYQPSVFNFDVSIGYPDSWHGQWTPLKVSTGAQCALDVGPASAAIVHLVR